MSILKADYSGNTTSVMPIHNELLTYDPKYLDTILKTAINPEKSFKKEMLDYINDVVEKTGGFKPFHYMGIISAGTNPFTGGQNFIENPEKDAVMVAFTDKGLLFLGTKAAHTFYWDNILYTIDMGGETLILQIGNSYQLLVSDPNFYYLFTKLINGLKEDGFNLLEFIQK